MKGVATPLPELSFEQWGLLLHESGLHPSNQVRSEATPHLNRRLKTKTCVPALFGLLQKSHDVGVRQLAGVLLRKHLPRLWIKLDNNLRVEMQKVLPEMLIAEQVSIVRSAIASVMSVIARLTVPFGQWPDLLVFLFNCTRSQDPIHRETAIKLFQNLTETIGETLRPHFKVLIQIFMAGLQDSVPQVRLATLKSVGVLIEWLDAKEEDGVTQLIPRMVDVVKYCLVQKLEDDIVKALEVFDDLVELSHPQVIQSLPPLASFMLEIAANSEYSPTVRTKALLFIEYFASSHSKAMIRHNLILPTLQAIFKICSTPDEDEDEELLGSLSCHRAGAQALDVIAVSLPTKHVFQPAIQGVETFIVSQNPYERRAALAALAVLAEGCLTKMLSILDTVLQKVLPTFSDPERIVREAACLVISHFSQHLQPYILDYHTTIIPVLMKSLFLDTNETVNVRCCFAIEQFTANLKPEDITPYIGDLMNKLLTLVTQGTRKIQENAVAAIGAIASAAESEFLPYLPLLANPFLTMMSQKEETYLVLRARATEAIGMVAVAVGKKPFEPYLKQFFEVVLQGLSLDFSELSESSFNFFSNLALTLEQDFTPFLSFIMPTILESAASSSGLIPKEDEEGGFEGDDEYDEEDDDEEGGGSSSYSVHDSFLDEKTAATQAIGVLASCTKAAFLPYLEQSLHTLEDLAQYFHEEVRHAAVISMSQLLEVTEAAFPRPVPWKKGGSGENLTTESQKVVDLFVPAWIYILMKDEDRGTVGAAAQAIGKACKIFGPGAIEAHVVGAVTCLVNVLNQESDCQQKDPDEGIDDDDDDELNLFNHVTEALGEIARAAGTNPNFEPLFKPVLKTLAKYCASDIPSSYRSIAVGSISEIADQMEHNFKPHVNQFLVLLIEATTDEDPFLRRNAVYGVGVLFQIGGPDAFQFVPNALMGLHRSFISSKGQDEIPIVDNACGTIARLILLSPPNLPLDQVLAAFLGSLPLKSDLEPTKLVVLSLAHLIQTNNPVTVPHYPTIISILLRILLQISKNLPGLVEADKSIIASQVSELLRGFSGRYPTEMNMLLLTFQADEQNALKAFL